MVMLLWISSFALAASEQQTLLQTKVEVVLEVDDVHDAVLQPNCQSFSATGDCKICANGFHLNSLAPASCVPCSATTHCQHCSIDPLKCDACAPGLFLDLVEGSCTESKIDGCGHYKFVQGEVTCQKCLDSHRKDIDGSCVSCAASDCRSCEADVDTCDTCHPGFFLKTTGDKACVACEAHNCERCNVELGQCSGCAVGFTFDDDLNCVECHTSGCHMCETDRSVCDKCQANLALNDGTCCGPCPTGTGVEVCALNGQTYSNACEAGCANQVVQHQGQCSNDCADDKHEVCGDDEKIYKNGCLATAAGAKVVDSNICMDNKASQE